MSAGKLHHKRFVQGVLTLAMVLAGVIAGSGFVAAQSPAPRSENAVDTRGTPFRGIALGDNRKQVNVALSELGLRCMTDDEKALLAKKQITLLEQIANVDACRIIAYNANMRGGSDLDYYIDDIVQYELITRSFRYTIVFDDGAVSALYLPPSFFDAQSLDGWSFARSIASAYLDPGSMVDVSDGGIRSRTPTGEAVTVAVSPNGRRSLLVVQAASSAGSFN